MGDCDRQHRARHAREKQRRRIENFKLRKPRLELFRAVAPSDATPRRRESVPEAGEHLAAVAHSQEKLSARSKKAANSEKGDRFIFR